MKLPHNTITILAAVLLVVILVSGCKPKDPPLKEYTEFYGAILHGEYDTVERLLKKYPRLISWEFNFAGQQADALTFAVVSNNAEIVELLLKAGAEPNYYNENGVTPLMASVQNERVGITQQLLIAGANVDKKAKDGSTVLHYLGVNGNVEIAEILLPIVQNIDEPKNGGFTPLAVALSEYHNDLAFQFIEAGADLKKALESAPHIIPEFVLNDNQEMLDYFWEQGVIDPYAMYQENNLFHYASWYNNVRFVRQLLDRGLWDYTPNPAGNTPLDIAREYGSQEVIDMVTEAGFGDE